MEWSCLCVKRISATSIQAILLGVLVLVLICISIVMEAFSRPIWKHSQTDHLYHQNIIDTVNNASLLWQAEYNRFASRALTLSVSAASAYTASSKSASIRSLNTAYHRAFDNETIENSINHWKEVLSNNITVPEEFDVRRAWPKCWTMHHITDQAGCGSCWAMAAVGAMSDRVCIVSNGTAQPLISAQDVIECCPYCGGCIGNFLPLAPYLYWKDEGLVSGGNYGSMDGCKPYKVRPDCGRPCPISKYLSAISPKCSKTCQPLHFPQSYVDNKIYGDSVYWLDHSGSAPPDVRNYMKPTDFNSVKAGMYELDNKLISIIKGRKLELLQKELMLHGPFTACFPISEDFQHYKTGIYNYTIGKLMYSHCVKIIGWGKDMGHPYWLAVNTWGRTWGENGFFRLLRGNSETQSISLHTYLHDFPAYYYATSDSIRTRELHGEDILAGIPLVPK